MMTSELLTLLFLPAQQQPPAMLGPRGKLPHPFSAQLYGDLFLSLQCISQWAKVVGHGVTG